MATVCQTSEYAGLNKIKYHTAYSAIKSKIIMLLVAKLKYTRNFWISEALVKNTCKSQHFHLKFGAVAVSTSH